MSVTHHTNDTSVYRQILVKGYNSRKRFLKCSVILATHLALQIALFVHTGIGVFLNISSFCTRFYASLVKVGHCYLLIVWLQLVYRDNTYINLIVRSNVTADNHSVMRCTNDNFLILTNGLKLTNLTETSLREEYVCCIRHCNTSTSRCCASCTQTECTWVYTRRIGDSNFFCFRIVNCKLTIAYSNDAFLSINFRTTRSCINCWGCGLSLDIRSNSTSIWIDIKAHCGQRSIDKFGTSLITHRA